MDFQDLRALPQQLADIFGSALALREISAAPYAELKWPKLLPVMHFETKRWLAPAFGSVFGMSTRAMGGKMQLATFVCTPNRGGQVPLLLADVMAFGEKRAVFVEYYDCTRDGAAADLLQAVHEKYAAIEDYAEKPAWYVGERAPYSLIKGGAQSGQLLTMLADSVQAYAQQCAAAGADNPAGADNREKLASFIDRMVREGNPSSETMDRVLGAAGAESFFRSAVMPAVYPSDTQ